MKQLWFLLITICIAFPVSAQQDTLLIHFDYNKSGITTSAAACIDSCLLSNKNRFTIQQIELYGHCDAIGSNRYNDSLSIARLAAAREYLLQKDMAPGIFARSNGFGKRQPLNSNTNETERLLNRRVEIIIHKTAVVPETTKAVVQQPTASSNLSDLIKDTATKVGSSIVLKNLNFLPGRHYLVQQSQPIVEELYTIMHDNPRLQIEIQGHVCCSASGSDGRDTDTNTWDLSVQRARHIYQLLVNAGIDPNRMRYTGFGGSRKLYPEEKTTMEQNLNRRVEIKILSK